MIEAGSGASEHNLIDPDLINPKTSPFVSDLKDWTLFHSENITLFQKLLSIQ